MSQKATFKEMSYWCRKRNVRAVLVVKQNVRIRLYRYEIWNILSFGKSSKHSDRSSKNSDKYLIFVLPSCSFWFAQEMSFVQLLCVSASSERWQLAREKGTLLGSWGISSLRAVTDASPLTFFDTSDFPIHQSHSDAGHIHKKWSFIIPSASRTAHSSLLH